MSDLAPLASLTALQHLDCGDTQVSDLSPLASLTALQGAIRLVPFWCWRGRGARCLDVYPAPDGAVWFTARSAGKLGQLAARLPAQLDPAED